MERTRTAGSTSRRDPHGLPDPRRVRSTGKPLVYLDSRGHVPEAAAGDRRRGRLLRHHNANAHRAIYTLGEEATELFEGARAKLAGSSARPTPATIVFTRGTTESINLVAHGWGRKFLREGDEILLTEMEHHSNIVPWQFAARGDRRGAAVHPADRRRAAGPLRPRVAAHRAHEDPRGDRHVERARHVPPLRELIDAAHAVGAIVLVDGGAVRAASRGRRRRPRTATSSRSRGTRCSAPPPRAGCTRKRRAARARWIRSSGAAR